MPTFLDNSFDQLRRGYDQMYGPALANGPQPAHLVRSGGPTPLYVDPATGQAYKRVEPAQAPAPAFPQQPNYQVPAEAVQPASTPMAYNPEVGQPIGGYPNAPVSDPAQLGPQSLITPEIYRMIAAQSDMSKPGAGKTSSGTQPSSPTSQGGGASGGNYFSSAPGLGTYYVGPSPGAGMSGYITPTDAAMGAPLGAGEAETIGRLAHAIFHSMRGANLDMAKNPEVGQGLGAIAGMFGGGGGGGGGGMSSVASGASGYAKQFAENQPDFEIDPSKLAGPVPNPAYFVPIALRPNTGGQAPWAA